MKNLFSGDAKDWIVGYGGPEFSTTQVMAMSHFQSLAGIELEYYGADSGDSTFMVDSIVFKILEDPNDGYRSTLGAIDYTDQHNSIFFKTPVARVRIETYDTAGEPDDRPSLKEHGGDDYDYALCENQGYRLVDVTDGHVWLEFGTHNYDDYYPIFIFRHTPKAIPLKTALGDSCPELSNFEATNENHS